MQRDGSRCYAIPNAIINSHAQTNDKELFLYTVNNLVVWSLNTHSKECINVFFYKKFIL